MKIHGLTLEQVKAASNAVSPLIGVKFQPIDASKPTELEGYFSAKYAGSQWRATVASTGYKHSWSPCACFYAELLSKFTGLGGGSWSFSLYKHKITWSSGKHKMTLALSKKGLVCHHSASDPLPVATAPSKPAAKPAKLETPSGKLLTFPMLAGEPLEPGEPNVSVVGLKGKTRDVYTATTSLYVLEECKIAALRVPATTTSEIPDHMLMRACQAVQWRNRVLRYSEHFANTLARNFFDFLTMACYGEARYKQGGAYTFDDATMKQGRSTAYQSALRFDPRDLLPKLSYVFHHYAWGGSIGGPKWGHIADTAALYFKPEFRTVPIAFVDHCVDLAHNGGLAFNKGYLLGNPASQSSYMKMLDEKRNGSLLDSTMAHPISAPVAELLSTGVGLGLVRRPRATFQIKDDVTVPVFTWGSELVNLYHGHGTVSSSAPITADETEGTENAEVYPDR